MALDLSTFTTRGQQALAAAVQSAAAAGNPAVEPVHLLDALLSQSGGTTGPFYDGAVFHRHAGCDEAQRCRRRR